jgi:hypothetical protein
MMRFILNDNEVKGSNIENLIDLMIKLEEKPKIYQPREGKVNSNFDLFNTEQKEFLYNYAGDLISKFGYDSVFKDVKTKNNFLYEQNERAFKQSLFVQNESDEVTSIFINYPALLLRKKSMLYPDGRTSYRFKR